MNMVEILALVILWIAVIVGAGAIFFDEYSERRRDRKFLEWLAAEHRRRAAIEAKAAAEYRRAMEQHREYFGSTAQPWRHAA